MTSLMQQCVPGDHLRPKAFFARYTASNKRIYMRFALL